MVSAEPLAGSPCRSAWARPCRRPHGPARTPAPGGTRACPAVGSAARHTGLPRLQPCRRRARLPGPRGLPEDAHARPNGHPARGRRIHGGDADARPRARRRPGTCPSASERPSSEVSASEPGSSFRRPDERSPRRIGAPPAAVARRAANALCTPRSRSRFIRLHNHPLGGGNLPRQITTYPGRPAKRAEIPRSSGIARRAPGRSFP